MKTKGPRRSKYNARKTTVDGIIFDSKKEAEYYLYLCQQMKDGKIDSFERQVRFDLIPSQYEGCRCVERPVFYKADFVTWRRGERLDVVDCKGMRLPVYVIKRKLMLWVHGIKIKEV